jgi:hypothetical protein
MFKAAYEASFTEDNITSAFKAISIWPIDRTVVTKRFDYSTPPNQTDILGLSQLSPAD